METHFAPAERASDDQLRMEVDLVSHNPVIDALMGVVNGLLAVLNENRQILAVNETLMALLGIENPDQALGLRPGEAISCVHSNEMPGGCGTAEACASCGAAISIVSSLAENHPVARTCAVTVKRHGVESDWFLRVQACPTTVSGRRVILLYLQDITQQQQWAALERVFFHDISNIVTGLLGTSELLAERVTDSSHDLANEAYRLAVRLAKEVELQKCLARDNLRSYQGMMHETTAQDVVNEVRRLFRNHPVAQGRRLSVPDTLPSVPFKTDLTLLTRVLSSMLINAFEATPTDGEVKLWAERDDEWTLTFCVWNAAAIPDVLAKRIFQRNFTTKEGPGRGLGTYSMRLFGEELLGGKVSFTSSPADGTVFCIRLAT